MADLHETYGIDTADRDLMRSRSWYWLQGRIFALIGRRTRVHWEHLSGQERSLIGEALANGREVLPWR